jgi:hypothetical protein
MEIWDQPLEIRIKAAQDRLLDELRKRWGPDAVSSLITREPLTGRLSRGEKPDARRLLPRAQSSYNR